MINENLLEEKLKYLTIANSRDSFEIKKFGLELYYDDSSHTSIQSYEIDITFDYNLSLDPDMYSFAHDIQRMSEKMRKIISEYVLSKEGKIISNENEDMLAHEGSIWKIDYEADAKHIFEMSYRFEYF